MWMTGNGHVKLEWHTEARQRLLLLSFKWQHKCNLANSDEKGNGQTRHTRMPSDWLTDCSCSYLLYWIFVARDANIKTRKWHINCSLSDRHHSRIRFARRERDRAHTFTLWPQVVARNATITITSPTGRYTACPRRSWGQMSRLSGRRLLTHTTRAQIELGVARVRSRSSRALASGGNWKQLPALNRESHKGTTLPQLYLVCVCECLPIWIRTDGNGKGPKEQQENSVVVWVFATSSIIIMLVRASSSSAQQDCQDWRLCTKQKRKTSNCLWCKVKGDQGWWWWKWCGRWRGKSLELD